MTGWCQVQIIVALDGKNDLSLQGQGRRESEILGKNLDNNGSIIEQLQNSLEPQGIFLTS